MFETEHDNWENVQEPRSQGENPGNEVECCAVRVARARARHKSLIMTSNIHFVWRSTDEAKLEQTCSEKESDYIDHYTGNNSSHDNKSYVCL